MPKQSAPAPEVKLAETVKTYNLTLPLIFQGAYLGDVPVAASPDGHIAVNVERFIGLLGERLSPEMTAALRLYAADEQVAPIETFAPAGIVVVYDTAKLELRVTIPVDKQGGQSLSVENDREERGRPSLVATPPEDFSGSLTFTARQSYTWSPSAAEGFDPFRVSADLAANFFGLDGVYLFAQGEFDEGADEHFHFGNVVLMHDDVERAMRYSLGDVTPTPAGFQSSPLLAGLSIQRQYGELQPFRNIRPSGLFRFSIDRSSTVDVVVNGTTIRTLRLEAGQYDLKDFPLFNGLNDIELYATDEFGRRLIASFSQFYSSRLLNPGVFEFGATAGLPQNPDNGDALTYDDDKATFSGYARFGLLDDVTIGGNFQIDTLQWLAGGEIGWATPIGTIGVVAGWSDTDVFGSGYSTLVNYEASAEEFWVFKNTQLNLAYLYTSEFFAAVGTPIPEEPIEHEVRGRLSMQLPYEFGIGFSASYAQGRNLEPNETRYGVSISRNLGFADLSLSNERTERNGELDENRVLLSLSMPLSDRENTRYSYDSANDQYQGEYSRFQRPELDDWGVRAQIGRDNEQFSGGGEFSYNANRFQMLLQHDAIADSAFSEVTSQRSSYTIASQLAWAGDDVAFGRPVGQRFAIIAAHETLEENQVGVTQNKGSKGREAETDFFGPALVAAGGAYQPQSVYVDVENLPAGYNVGTGQYDLFPGPASGYALTVGSDASHVVMGNLIDAEGKPLSLLGGEVRAKDREGVKPVLVFTNSGGRFFAEGLAPGHYDMVLGPKLDIVVPIEVPEGNKGVIDVGTITVKKGS